jgi:hypothetical protein
MYIDKFLAGLSPKKIKIARNKKTPLSSWLKLISFNSRGRVRTSCLRVMGHPNEIQTKKLSVLIFIALTTISPNLRARPKVAN